MYLEYITREGGLCFLEKTLDENLIKDYPESSFFSQARKGGGGIIVRVLNRTFNEFFEEVV